MPDAGHLMTDRGINTEFLVQFPAERIARLFALFDLAPGEFPFQRHGLVTGALADQNLVILEDQRGHHVFHDRRGALRTAGHIRSSIAIGCSGLVFPTFHPAAFSNCLPTSAAQYSTRARSASPKAAGKWLSMSSSPTTLPRTNTGTTISDLVSVEQAR